MDNPEPFMLRDQAETDQRRLRHAIAQVKKLLRDAQELIEKSRRTRH